MASLRQEEADDPVRRTGPREVPRLKL